MTKSRNTIYIPLRLMSNLIILFIGGPSMNFDFVQAWIGDDFFSHYFSVIFNGAGCAGTVNGRVTGSEISVSIVPAAAGFIQ